MLISGVVITYNEEKNIENCLKSLKLVADEIIVVDSYSTDKTKEICLTFGCSFIEHRFEGYGEQKNYANSLANFDYILSLDADEILSDELVTLILKEKIKPRADAFSTNRKNNIAGKWTRGGFYPDRKIRLWRKGTAQWNLLIVHEETVLNPESTLIHLGADLLHFPSATYSEFLARCSSHNAQKAIAYYNKRKKISYLKYLSRKVFKFFRSFFIKSGLLDGVHGFKIAINLSRSEKALYAELKKCYLLEKEKKEDSNNG